MEKLRMRNLGSTLDAVARCCVLENTLWVQMIYPSWWPSLIKDMQFEPFCVRLV